tara:strand:- start:613 stop:795 length:183 start_codon:yes stop_codon:yes gene_type:complete
MKNLIGFCFLWFLLSVAFFMLPVESNYDFVIYFPIISLLVSGILLSFFCFLWLFDLEPKS